MRKFTRTGWGFAKKGTKLLRHWGTKGICHSEALAEESFLKGTRLLRHYGTKVNLPLPTGEVDFVSERSEFTKSGEGSIFKVRNGTKKRCAFTLSEVLIVLAVLGVVAAMTIPDLIQEHQERAAVTAANRIYSILNQAVDMSVAENGPVETWDWGTGGNGQSVMKLFQENLKPYLRISKDCGTGKGCWSNGYIKNIQGQNVAILNSATNRTKSILTDGTSLSLASLVGACSRRVGYSTALQHVCGYFEVDINGVKSPNAYGKDVFAFYVTQEGIIPFGTKSDFSNSLSSSCRSGDSGGCTAWVIQHKNMDYLRETVSW